MRRGRSAAGRLASPRMSAEWRRGFEQFTTDVLFRDLWLRPGLAPRDRSLVTVSALIALGACRTDYPYHLNRAMDRGFDERLRRPRSLTHLAFLRLDGRTTYLLPFRCSKTYSRSVRAESPCTLREDGNIIINISFEGQVALVTGAGIGARSGDSEGVCRGWGLGCVGGLE